MPDKANITPRVFKWARESARMTRETAAAKVPVSADKLKEWEEGNSQPTIRQAQILAKAYKRPFALLFLPEIPKDFQPLQDFRKKGSKTLGTASIFIIREIQQKQEWMSEINEENNEDKLSIVGKFSINDNPQIVADDILKVLDIDPLNYQNENPIREWIDKAESNGIFISRTSFIHTKLKLVKEEIQGFVIADSYAPFVFINSDDWDASQLFTLVHELAHIWIAESGISNEIESELINKSEFNSIELFCNQVAADALIPVQFMKSLNTNIFNSIKEVFTVSKRLGVSSFAFLVRALNLNIIPLNIYQKLKTEAEAEYKEFLKREEEKKAEQKEKKGGPSPYLLRVNKNSRLFTQIVLDGFHGGLIEPALASILLNTPTNKFQKLEAQLYR
jgi:Zn-dependent peptidase ImmA (M78 family)/DNA-binding XRE family transcriptional regulator